MHVTTADDAVRVCINTSGLTHEGLRKALRDACVPVCVLPDESPGGQFMVEGDSGREGAGVGLGGRLLLRLPVEFVCTGCVDLKLPLAADAGRGVEGVGEADVKDCDERG